MSRELNLENQEGAMAASDDGKSTHRSKINIRLDGRITSIVLDRPFWDALCKIAEEQGLSAQELVRRVAAESRCTNLTSSIRVFVLNHYMTRSSSAG